MADKTTTFKTLFAPPLKNVSTPTRVFAVLFVTALVLELVAEGLMSRLVADDATRKSKFWVRYVIGALIFILTGLVSYIIVELVAKSGWPVLAWILAIIPALTIAGVMITFNAANTAIDLTSGHNVIGLWRLMMTKATKKKSA